MRSVTLMVTLLLLAVGPGLLAGCGTASGGMNGPTMSNRVADVEGPPELQSNDVLAREQGTDRAIVKHILVGWRDLGRAYGGHLDERAGARSRADADALATQLLARVRAGAAIEPLMQEFSEDPGSRDGSPYTVTRDGQYVFEFKRLCLRLDVGEAGLVLTQFGWHVVRRTE
ncbi:MAG: hypothetical protein EXR73_11275 [Myxococcales bacterium]|nr:hypothetical protein [Myxococcales bacterium]